MQNRKRPGAQAGRLGSIDPYRLRVNNTLLLSRLHSEGLHDSASTASIPKEVPPCLSTYSSRGAPGRIRASTGTLSPSLKVSAATAATVFLLGAGVNDESPHPPVETTENSLLARSKLIESYLKPALIEPAALQRCSLSGEPANRKEAGAKIAGYTAHSLRERRSHSMQADGTGTPKDGVAPQSERDQFGISLNAWLGHLERLLGGPGGGAHHSPLMHFVRPDHEHSAVFGTSGAACFISGLARILRQPPLDLPWVGFYVREGSVLVLHEEGCLPEGLAPLPQNLPAEWPESNSESRTSPEGEELLWLPLGDFAQQSAVGSVSDTIRALPLVILGELFGFVCVLASDARRIGELGLLPTIVSLSLPLATSLYTRHKVLARELHWVAEGATGHLHKGVRSLTPQGVLAANPMFPDLVGQSAPFLHALALAQRWAAGRAPVLITGETGTGKELLARAIHALSERRNGPWVAVNCPAIPRELAESELFGHEKGAFTGATETRQGRFERADGGVLFLDEVGDLPHSIQAKLLRVLQEGEIERVGSARSRKVDVRIIAATNRDLQDAVRNGDFRQDLYHRLAALPIHLPPLRDRTGDVELLAWHFLRKSSERYHKQIDLITPSAMERLRAYDWPGNVRELEYMIERAVLLAEGPAVGLEDLSELSPDPSLRCTTLHAQLRAEKRRRVENTLRETLGNCAEAARLLGMSRGNFSRLLRALRVDPNKFRPK